MNDRKPFRDRLSPTSGQAGRPFRGPKSIFRGAPVYQNENISGPSLVSDASGFRKGVYYLKCTFGIHSVFQKVVLE